MLDLRRIETGHLDLEPESFDLRLSILAAADVLLPLAQRHGIRLALPHADQGELSADPRRFRQMLLNLLSNAVKFTPAGGEVRVQVERADATVRIVVVDTGSGIGPDDLPRVFEPFGRVARRGPRGPEGSGLGLAITRELVEAHGGRIEAQSAVGFGSRFTLVFPSAL